MADRVQEKPAPPSPETGLRDASPVTAGESAFGGGTPASGSAASPAAASLPAERPYAVLPEPKRPRLPVFAQWPDGGRLWREAKRLASLTFRRRSREEEFEASLAAFMPPVEAARRRRGLPSTRLLFMALCLTFFVLLFWAAIAEIDETVLGSGQVIPSQRVQHIQNLEGGILREILVREGQQVDKGDLLLRIDNEQAGSAYRDAMSRGRELEASTARVKAELGGGEPDYPASLRASAPEVVARHSVLLEARRKKDENERNTLEAQLELRKLEEREQLARRESLTESIDIATRQRDMAKRLMQNKSYSEMDYLNLAQQVTQLQGEFNILDNTIPKTRAAIREAEEKLQLHRAETEARLLQELNTAEAELTALRELLVAGEDRVTRTEVRSPVRGVINNIHITTAGGVIMPGEVIMDVVPVDDSLIIEVRVSPQDIAFLFVGQKARIRLTAYDFAIYGALDATLETISADTIESKQGEIFYLVKLRTATTMLEHNGRQLPIMPGMMATADIITGKKTVLDYILKPILKAKQAALRER